MPDRIRVFESPHDLGDAAELILDDQGLDIVVVPGFSDRTRNGRFTGQLYEALPELHDVDDALQEWWGKNGSPELEIAGPATEWMLNSDNVVPHIDSPLEPTIKYPYYRWYGPIKMTFMHLLSEGVTSRFGASSIDMPFSPTETPDRESYEIYRKAYYESIGMGPYSDFDELRTIHPQSQGEILFFRNMPFPTMHGVEITGDKERDKIRLAQELAYYVVRPANERGPDSK